MEKNQRGFPARNKTVWLAAIGGVIGPIVFVALIVVGGVLYEGYSHVSQKISELGGEGAEYALLQNLNFIMLGVLVIGFSWALARWFGPSFLGPALIALFGLSSSIANGLLPCDLGCSGETTVGLLHNITGMAGFLAAILGMFVLARRWQSDSRWKSHVDFTRRAAFVAIGGLVWFVATQALDAQATAGLAQRVFAGALLLWIATTAARLAREVASADDTRLNSAVAARNPD